MMGSTSSSVSPKVRAAAMDKASFRRWNETMARKYDPEMFHRHPNRLVRWIEARRERTALTRCAILLLPGGLLAIPYWQNVVAVMAHPGFDHLEMGAGVVYTHAPLIPWVHVVLIAAVAAGASFVGEGECPYSLWPSWPEGSFV